MSNREIIGTMISLEQSLKNNITELEKEVESKPLIIDNVIGQSEQLCDNPHCQDGTVEVIYGEPLRCSNCDK